jgi:hypothetical protein
MIDWPLSLADVTISTIHARLNGAYVYPDHAYAHELLTVAAMLGHLLLGRPVQISPAFADCLIEVLSAARGGSGDCSPTALQTYAEIAYGSERLRALCKRVRATGYAAVAKPRPYHFNSQTPTLTTDSRLADRIQSIGLMASSSRVA